MTIIEALAELDRIADGIDLVWSGYPDDKIKPHVDKAGVELMRMQMILAQQLIDDYQDFAEDDEDA